MTPESPMDLLSAALVQTRLRTCVIEATLPHVLDLLASDAVEAFDALMPHQEHAWYALLVQLAAIACPAGTALPNSPGAWRAALLAATEGRSEPWLLVGPDLTKPAFLQPPAPGGLSTYKELASPERLDLPVLAKSFDVKSSRLARGRPEHWLFALVSCQTSQGFSGRGNYGIFRMNGGFGNRAAVSITPSRRWGARWRRDVELLRASHDKVAADFGFRVTGGKALIWLDPWDGVASVPIAECDPWCIEACRRVRLVGSGDSIEGRFAPSTAAHLAVQTGDVGDPWIPIKATKEGAKALTTGGGGFHYAMVSDLLTKDGYTPSLAMSDPSKGAAWLQATALTRGQGQTDGFHERFVRLPASARRRLASPDDFAVIRELAKRRVEQVGLVRSKVLYASLLALLNAGGDGGTHPVERWTEGFQREVDAAFFPKLWEAAEATNPGVADAAWETLQRDLAWRQFEDAVSGSAIPLARRSKAIAAGESVFRAGVRQHLPNIVPPKEEQDV